MSFINIPQLKIHTITSNLLSQKHIVLENIKSLKSIVRDKNFSSKDWFYRSECKDLLTKQKSILNDINKRIKNQSQSCIKFE